MLGRTFKCFSRCIELRAYIPNTTVENIGAQALDVAVEITKALPEVTPFTGALQIASNRAGLHLAFVYKPADGSVQSDRLRCNPGTLPCQGYERARSALEAAGWKQCKGE